ncbi:MAG: hypothetical protein JZD40_04860 [Sulfolobus sp.]|nr:hypothetical protein [Sulfolobus sp.]
MLLGDASVTPSSPSRVTSRISMAQSIVNFPYLWFVWGIIGPLCQSLPYVNFHTLGGKIYLNIVIRTRGYAALSLLLNQFIVDGVKRVPIDIFNLLTPIAIAHWIMCNGGRQANGLVLCTDSFTVFDVVQLMNVLLIKYDIYSTINYNNKQPRIYINRVNLLKLRRLVLPHMCKFSQYKLGL